jgi:O-antigen/teichoic acid export membrane protein
MSLAKKVAHNTIIQLLGKIISTILGLLALALITRYLGPTGFGQYTTVNTFLTFFAVVADLGLTLVTVQMISGHHDDENKIINNLFSLRLVSALILLALAPTLVLLFPYDSAIRFGVLITMAAFLFPALNQIIVGLFQKKLCMDRDAGAEIFSRLVLILGILISRRLNFGLNGILLSTVAAAAANFILHYLFALKFATIKLAFDTSLWKKILTKSWPLAVTIVLNLIYLRADVLILSLFRPVAEVGLYGATYKVIDVLTTMPFMFAGLILPILTAAWVEHNQDYFKKVLQKSFDFMAIVAIPLIIGAQFLAGPIMTLTAGQDFAAAGPILRLLIFAVAAIFLGTMFSHAVIALDKQKKMIIFYVFTSISSLIAYFLLIPKFSYFGAAAVTIYSELLIAIFSAWCIYKYGHFRTNFKTSAKALASGVIMGGFIYFFPAYYQASLGRICLIILLASLIYFFSLYLMGGVKPEDLAAIFKKQKKSGSPTYDPSTNF